MPDTRRYFCLTPLYAKNYDRVPVCQADLGTHAKDVWRKLNKMQPGGGGGGGGGGVGEYICIFQY